MAYLVDTNVLSEQMKPAPNAGVLDWLRDNQPQLYTSTITIGEIKFGIESLPQGRRKESFQAWLVRLEELMGNRILAYTRATAHIWGQMQADLRRNGRQLPTFDGMIAAIAQRYELTLVTRNVSDFEATDIPLINPFSD